METRALPVAKKRIENSRRETIADNMSNMTILKFNEEGYRENSD